MNAYKKSILYFFISLFFTLFSREFNAFAIFYGKLVNGGKIPKNFNYSFLSRNHVV